jgi:hypothetical protein
MSNKRSIWIGFDPREADAFAVARHSIQRRLTQPIPVNGLVLSKLREQGLYYRPTSIRDGRLWDEISEAGMSTEFSNSRFLVKEMAGSGWALFVDADFLALENAVRLFDLADDSKAVMVVKHNHVPTSGTKMDGQVQAAYSRKNWSSCMLINCEHRANRALTVEYVNSVPGRDLHAFKWLADEAIGELPPEWNYLVGVTRSNIQPKFIHMTEGVPSMAGYENCEFADEWRAELTRWAA